MVNYRWVILVVVGLVTYDITAGMIIPEIDQYTLTLASGDPILCLVNFLPGIPFSLNFIQLCKNGFVAFATIPLFPTIFSISDMDSYSSPVDTMVVAPGLIEDPVAFFPQSRQTRQVEDYFTQVQVQFRHIGPGDSLLASFTNLVPGVTPSVVTVLKWSVPFEEGQRRKKRQVNQKDLLC